MEAATVEKIIEFVNQIHKIYDNQLSCLLRNVPAYFLSLQDEELPGW